MSFPNPFETRSTAQRRIDVLEIARAILTLQDQIAKLRAEHQNQINDLEAKVLQKQKALEGYLTPNFADKARTKRTTMSAVREAARTARDVPPKATPAKATKLVEVRLTNAECILAFLRADPDTMHYPFEIARKLKMDRTIVNATLQAMYKAKDVDRSNSKYYAVRKPIAGKTGKKS